MGVKLLLSFSRKPVVAMGHSLLFAVSVWVAASWGQKGEDMSNDRAVAYDSKHQVGPTSVIDILEYRK